jgi:predicted NBD/HSP70 family sugar kinase
MTRTKRDAGAPRARVERRRGFSGTNLERAGDHNQRVTLHAIRVSGPVTRTDLVLMTGLASAAVANITNRLLQQRLIVKAGTIRGGRGQPAVKFAVNANSCYALGLNVDRDHMTLVLVDFAGRVRARSSRQVPFALPEDVQKFVRRSASQLLSRAKVSPAKVVGLGVAFPDDIQRADLPGQPREYAAWGEISLGRLLASVLPLPVFVENDAAAASIGEMHFGLGQRHQCFFYILITAGLGGGLVVDGHYVRGATGRSGELGLLPSRVADGERSTVQSIVSLSALAEQLASHGFRISTPRELAHIGAEAEQILASWIGTAVDALESTLVSINCLINPEIILIGGRLPARVVDQLAERLNDRMRAYKSIIPSVAPVARAALADDAPAVGAAIIPFTERLLPTRRALMKTSGTDEF